MKFYNTAAFLDGKQIPKRGSGRYFPVINYTMYDGSRLDELYVTAVLETRQDVEDLIKFLEITKYCLPETVPPIKIGMEVEFEIFVNYKDHLSQLQIQPINATGIVVNVSQENAVARVYWKHPEKGEVFEDMKFSTLKIK